MSLSSNSDNHIMTFFFNSQNVSTLYMILKLQIYIYSTKQNEIHKIYFIFVEFLSVIDIFFTSCNTVYTDALYYKQL